MQYFNQLTETEQTNVLKRFNIPTNVDKSKVQIDKFNRPYLQDNGKIMFNPKKDFTFDNKKY